MWAASSTFRVGSLHIGVRSTTPGVDALVRRAFAAHLVEGAAAPANYSVAILDPGSRSAVRPLHLLFRSTCLVLRSPSPVTVLTALASYLSSHDEEPAGLLKLRAVALVRGTEAVLVPEGLRRTVAVNERALNRAGLRVVHESSPQLDLATGELLVLPPSVEPGRDALAAVAEAYGLVAHQAPPVGPDRYRVGEWLLDQVPGDPRPMSRAEAVPYLMPLVTNRGDVGRVRAVTGVARALRDAVPVTVRGLTTHELVRRLAAAYMRT